MIRSDDRTGGWCDEEEMLKVKSIGVTGHQQRDGLDWSWTRSAIAEVLHGAGSIERALTSLAVGTDQVFAEAAFAQSIKVQAVIPFGGYERCFDGSGLEAYRRLLACCDDMIVLERTGSDEEAFLAAGIRVADDSDLLIAVWDGEPAAGLGGTADVVAHALGGGREVVHLDPFSCSVRRLRG